jgi:hypothetical protein
LRTRNPRKRYKTRVLFQMCCVWCRSWCSWAGGASLRSRNPRKRYKPGSCLRCAVFGVVSGVLGRVGRGCVPGIPGRDIIRVPFQMCCVWRCSWVDWGVVAYQESQEEIYSGSCFRCPVFCAVQWWIGALLRTPGIPGRDMYNQGPI